MANADWDPQWDDRLLKDRLQGIIPATGTEVLKGISPRAWLCFTNVHPVGTKASPSSLTGLLLTMADHRPPQDPIRFPSLLVRVPSRSNPTPTFNPHRQIPTSSAADDYGAETDHIISISSSVAAVDGDREDRRQVEEPLVVAPSNVTHLVLSVEAPSNSGLDLLDSPRQQALEGRASTSLRRKPTTESIKGGRGDFTKGAGMAVGLGLSMQSDGGKTAVEERLHAFGALHGAIAQTPAPTSRTGANPFRRAPSNSAGPQRISRKMSVSGFHSVAIATIQSEKEGTDQSIVSYFFGGNRRNSGERDVEPIPPLEDEDEPTELAEEGSTSSGHAEQSRRQVSSRNSREPSSTDLLPNVSSNFFKSGSMIRMRSGSAGKLQLQVMRNTVAGSQRKASAQMSGVVEDENDEEGKEQDGGDAVEEKTGLRAVAELKGDDRRWNDEVQSDAVQERRVLIVRSPSGPAQFNMGMMSSPSYVTSGDESDVSAPTSPPPPSAPQKNISVPGAPNTNWGAFDFPGRPTHSLSTTRKTTVTSTLITRTTTESSSKSFGKSTTSFSSAGRSTTSRGNTTAKAVRKVKSILPQHGMKESDTERDARFNFWLGVVVILPLLLNIHLVASRSHVAAFYGWLSLLVVIGYAGSAGMVFQAMTKFDWPFNPVPDGWFSEALMWTLVSSALVLLAAFAACITRCVLDWRANLATERAANVIEKETRLGVS
ncbi:hypothetical protein HDU96_009139 [Phlyctochytrium bullatum]|nr:hypothetical protein HDU96_009139 [Phlyctochytrium bullatum]